ncbi:hypothetical protein L6452_35803 [Arctium lappa]|uniref:Uncharacterized protein n=1 Tax=Arctium lappa TaxID=4217 RepID=A0ACB8Y8Y8_ARCLA|nr:hypothetical protein L6452_35803 [Arctium lappa]
MENTVESNSTLVSKVPMLRSNEFDMWKIRIKQYILLTDYSMWDIIENGPSDEGKIGADGKRTPSKMDAERKTRQTEMKALSTLLLAIPNEYQHQFCNCTDGQMLWNALEKRFSVQIDQDDVNRKFLRSLGNEWTMYTVSFRQNEQLEEKELDDLYNDLRVFESEVETKKKPSRYVHNVVLDQIIISLISNLTARMSYQLNMSAGYNLDFSDMTLSEVKEKAKHLARQSSRNRGRADDCEREITKLKSEMLPLEAEIENLKIQNSSLLIQINALKENSKDSDNIIDLAGIIASKEKEIFDLQAKLKRSESSSTWSKKDAMQRELEDLRRSTSVARDTSTGLRQINSQLCADKDKFKDKVLSLEVEIEKMKEKATQDRDNTIAQDEMLKIEKERKEFAKKFSDFSRKAFEEKKSLELRCVKLSQQVSDFEKVIILEREKTENDKKKVELKDTNTDFSEEKKIFETEIAKLTGKLAELSTNIMKDKNAKSELHKKFDLIEKERNNLSSKIKELEEIVFKVKLTEHKTPESIAQSPKDDLADSNSSSKTASSSHISNVFYNPFCDSDDSLTSKSTDQIHPSNLFYDKNVDGSGNFKKTKSQKKSFWRRDDEKERGNWIWRVKGSSEEKKKEESFVHTMNAKWNYASKASIDSTANPESVNAANGVNQEKGNESVFEAFLSSHGNSSLINDDLEHLYPDDLEEMDIKSQMAMLSMRVKKFIKRTGRNNFSKRREDGAGFNKSKVEFYKCHLKGHFARECRIGVSQNNHQQAQTGSFNQNRNSAQALVSQQGMGFDWSDQAKEAIQNQALMAEVSDLPTEVLSNLCSQTCIDTVKRYRDHNQNMSDDLKILEKDIKDYVRNVERFEEQIKGFQANELQHTYDTNYWKWEKNDLELQLTKSKEENEKLRGELDKFHDKLRRGIGYNTTQPPYNNNYIPPKSDLLETKDRKDLPEGATEIDPLDEVVVEDKTEEEAGKGKENNVSGEIPLENNIITNEDCGRAWIKSNNIEKTKGKSRKVHYKQTTVVNPIRYKQCTCNKDEPVKHDKKRGNQRNWNNQSAQKQGVDLSKIFRPKPCFICGKLNHIAKHYYFNPVNQRMTFQRSMQKPFGYRKDERNHVAKKFVKSKSHMKKKTIKESVKMWISKSTKTVSTATTNSAADKVSAARSNTTAIDVSTANIVSTSSNINTANSVSAANKVSSAKPVSTANSVSTSKISTTSSVCAAKPIILTKATSSSRERASDMLIVVALGT